MGVRGPRLSTGRILVYSLASAGLNLIAITVSTWLLYFYCPPADSGRTQYLPVALAGVLMTVVSLWDAIIDPFIGHWSDNLRSRWGRRRPFILLAAPVTGLFTILIWTPPGGGSVPLNALYFIVILLIYNSAYSLVGIPYDATMPEMAPEAGPRLKLSYYKGLLGIVGVLIGVMVAAPLFDTIGPVAMGAVVGIVGMVTMLAALFGLRETTRPVGDPMPAGLAFLAALRNRQFLALLFSTLLVHVTYQMLLANLPYFVTLVLGESEGDVAVYQGVLILMIAITGPLWLYWNRKHSQRRLLNLSLSALVLTVFPGGLVGLLPGVPASVQAIVVMALLGFALGGYLILIYAMMGNVVDYDEMFTGRRREAIFYGTFSLAIGVGSSLGGLILPQLYNWLGYTRENPLGVRMAFVVMTVFVLSGLVAFRGYRLGDTPEETRRNMSLDRGGLPETTERV